MEQREKQEEPRTKLGFEAKHEDRELGIVGKS
ncbi:hypothetical protein A2U01_0101984, partial [Trifolium medium]|nr:hypothetical protein [Trifolium medium]